MILWIKRHNGLLCFLLAALCAAAVGWNFDALRRDPRAGQVAVNDPTSYVHDGGNGREYLVVEGGKEILALNGAREYLFSIEGGKRAGGFYNAQDAVSGADGDLYIHDQVKNENGKEIDSERIMVFDEQGQFQSCLFELEHQYMDGENRDRILGMAWVGGALRFIRTDRDALTLCRVDTDAGTVSEERSYPYQDAFRLVMDAALSQELAVYFSDKMGCVWQAGEDGGHRCIYDAATHGTTDFFSIAADLGCDGRGNVYFNDVGLREIRRIAPTGSVDTIIAKGEPMTERPENFNELPIYSAFTVSGDGLVTAAYSDTWFDARSNTQIYDYKLYLKSGGMDVEMNGSLLDKAGPVKVRGWLAVAAIAVLLLLAGFAAAHLIRSLKGVRLSRTTLIQIAVVGTALLASIVVSSVILSSTNGWYIQELTNRISNMAVLMARDLDAEALESLDDPKDYGGRGYQAIDSSIKEVLGSDINRERGVYAVLYRVQQDIVCAVYSDEGEHGTLWPMEGAYQGSGEEVIYQTGEMVQMAAFSNAEGRYMFTMAPILNDEDEVIGLIEVGIDLYSFSQSNEKLIRETILTVLMLIVTLVLLFSESTVFIRAVSGSLKERRRGLPCSVDIVRPLAFIAFFAGNMSTTFLPLFGRGLWDPSMGLQQEFAIALPLSAEVLFTAVFSLLGGFLVDRVGTRRLILIGSAIFAGGLVMCGVVPNLWSLIASNGALGAGEGLVLVSLNTFISGYEEEEQRNRGFSGYNAAYLSGMNCGTVVGSLLAEWVGYRPVFYAAGAVAAAALLLAVLCLEQRQSAGKAEAEEKTGGMSTLRFLLSPRVFAFFLFMLAPYLICASFLSYFFPIYGEENGLSTSFVAQAFLLSGVIAIYLGPVLTNFIQKRLGAQKSLISATGIYVGCFALFSLHTSIPVCFAIIGLLAVADSFGLSMQAVYFSDLPEVRRYGEGKAMGLNSAVESAAQTVGPIIFAGVLMLGVERGVMLLAQCVGGLLVLFIASGLLLQRRGAKQLHV